MREKGGGRRRLPGNDNIIGVAESKLELVSPRDTPIVPTDLCNAPNICQMTTVDSKESNRGSDEGCFAGDYTGPEGR
ncbi:hypothetical protein KQX54_014297 [Cotesia glomerata]|uniref:Uncharacterized protein n=1 Tax=Cotesia glomerata TaxID=32391 RepID=A0AAV7IKM3_COTGL|nr:hypothetical protein KQX54_014297 [Cotesia glomerata]